LHFGIVDVRDVSSAHLLGLTSPEAEGRHILSGGTMSMPEMGQALSRLVGKNRAFPRRKLPRILLYMLGPLNGLSWREIRNNVGYPIRFNNQKSKEELALIYRPMEETLYDQYKQLEADGLLD
jgi:nucleoside-diphosphate-sugar epimerase